MWRCSITHLFVIALLNYSGAHWLETEGFEARTVSTEIG
jgi:hypothetical protein